MADEKDSALRARPFTPPPPPFRGPATTARPSTNALTPPESRRSALFIGTRAPSKPAVALPSVVADIAQFAPDPQLAPPAAVAPPAAPAEPTRAAAESGLIAEPERNAGAAPLGEADASRAEAIAATEAMPWLFADPRTADRRPTPIAPMPVVTNAVASAEPAAPLDAAAVLESVAARIRAGRIDVGSLDPAAGEAATLAGVLAVLLRHRAG